MRVLGIETSCDETAVAIVEAPAGTASGGQILANVVYSQLTEHRRFGGVVPEIAARAHLERLDGLVTEALAEAGLGLADLCASFQRTVGDVLSDRCANALSLVPSPTLVVAGGVAANVYLRGRLEALAASHGARLVAPPIKLCTDNGAMIAWAGIERLRLGQTDELDFRPRPRWPLDSSAVNRV